MSRSDLNENFEKFSLDDWLAWMEAHHPRQIELGLDRIRAVAARLNISPCHSQRNAKVITVGGTNGKGSCVAFLENLLTANGYRVGAYTSPHLLRYNERVRIDRDVVGDDDLCRAFRAVHAALGEISLTYFEFGTLAALWLFQQQLLDVWVLEVGLGGRLDAVNIIDADAAILTTIDLDHQDWLGNDRESIGREKAGIFRSQHWAICVDPQPPQSVIDGAQTIGAKLLTLDRDIVVEWNESNWSWRVPALPSAPMHLQLPLTQLPWPSATAALTALHALQLRVDENSVGDVLTRTELAGRFQRIEWRDIEIVFDVAHNPQAASWLAQRLRNETVKPTAAVFEIMQDKDGNGIVDVLLAQIDTWFVGGLPDNARAMQPAALARLLGEHGADQIRVHATVADATTTALKSAKVGERIVVFGSFFTVAAAMEKIATLTSGEKG